MVEPSVVFFSDLKEERTTRATPEEKYDRKERWQYFKSLAGFTKPHLSDLLCKVFLSEICGNVE